MCDIKAYLCVVGNEPIERKTDDVGKNGDNSRGIWV